jgi:hypothetical protein
VAGFPNLFSLAVVDKQHMLAYEELSVSSAKQGAAFDGAVETTVLFRNSCSLLEVAD